MWEAIFKGVGVVGQVFNQPTSAQLQAQQNAQMLRDAQAAESARKMKNTIAAVSISLLVMAVITGLIIYSKKHSAKQ